MAYGWLISCVLHKKAQGLGLDIDRYNIQRAKRNQNDNELDNLSLIVSDICHLPLLRENFSVIVCCDVLEHVKSSERAIAELAASLKKGGKLFITTSNSYNPIMFLDQMLPRQILDRIMLTLSQSWYPRTRRDNPWSLQQKLNKYNLMVEKLIMLAAPPFAPLFHSEMQIPIRLLIVGRLLFYFWVIFDKLTNHFLKFLKEIILIIAVKK
jgi:2-polyprenyl-3-methyl-5-hydroxy-6-metoxy-1,4-benzoquinol methylase